MAALDRVGVDWPKQHSVLAILLLSANKGRIGEPLAEDLYAGALPVTAVTQVQRQISELRKVLGADGSIETRPPCYMIRLHPDQLDLSRFERLTEQARNASLHRAPARSAELYRAALARWRGERSRISRRRCSRDR